MHTHTHLRTRVHVKNACMCATKGLWRRGHVTASIACVPSKIQIKDKNQYLVCMNGDGQTANVTIISYKVLSVLNFARCQGTCPSSP